MSSDATLSGFHPATQAWFRAELGQPTAVQAAGWPAIQRGEHVLLAAPTGGGKTLAAFLAALDGLMVQALAGRLPDAVQVLYVSPLKALSHDVQKNLEAPLSGMVQALAATGRIAPKLRVACRTGDTPPSERQRILRRPPHVLVTTPESLYILLGSAGGQRLLKDVRHVIVDEVHALVASRRGSHLSLSLEHLAEIATHPIQRIGLSATQRPMVEVARFLVGGAHTDADGTPQCRCIDVTRPPELDIELVLPDTPLEALMAHAVWDELYVKLVALIEGHKTTLIFVNTRRMAERLAFVLEERLGAGAVLAHHGSLSAQLRHEAESRLKAGDLRALVATGSLELGIDIGSIDLVCQMGSVRQISTFVQRIGRADHRAGGTPKGRLFPLSRDELVECTAIIQCLRAGELDVLEVPHQPLDILAQQLVARCAAVPEATHRGADLLAWARRAHPYRSITEAEFAAVLQMVTEGFNTRRGRKGALLHHDAIHDEVRARRGAQLTALTCGGAIPDTGDFRVVLVPHETVVGSVNEEFAVDSHIGDIFVLGTMSWRIVGVSTGTVRVEHAGSQAPTMPFWFGESPSRSYELSHAVSRLRRHVAEHLDAPERIIAELAADAALSHDAMQQMVTYLHATQHALGCMPHDEQLVAERFFDQAGGMQLVLHSPFGSRLNRAWGLALRKRFCKSFNFELQAAATEDAIVLSLGEVHSFPLADVFRFLHPSSVRPILVQALLDAPMFQTRWRWNAGRALAVQRMWGGKRVAPQVQRMLAEDLVAAVFPDQIACAENIAGDREVPDHPLVNQTIGDCLHEAMDIDALEALLGRLRDGSIEVRAVDTPEPSPACHEILTARPYAFLDDGEAEERRTSAVYVRRDLRGADEPGAAGRLEPDAIAQVQREAWPRAERADELHDALLTMVLGPEAALNQRAPHWAALMQQLREMGRGALVRLGGEAMWACTERLPTLQAAYGERLTVADALPELVARRVAKMPPVDPEAAVQALVAGQLQVLGPVTVAELAGRLHLDEVDVEAALLRLEGTGFVLQGAFRVPPQPQGPAPEWCQRRLLARLHRLTVQSRRRTVQPVSIACYLRFLCAWHGVGAEAGRGRCGEAGVRHALTQLAGLELPARAWEADVLPARVQQFAPAMLDGLCMAGEVGWGRISPHAAGAARRPLGTSPIAVMARADAWAWRRALPDASQPAHDGPPGPELTEVAAAVLAQLQARGALFFREIVAGAGLGGTDAASGLAELAAVGLACADSFAGLRALLSHSSQAGGGRADARRLQRIERAGRWSLSELSAHAQPHVAYALQPSATPGARAGDLDPLTEQVRALLRRWGVVTRQLLAKENTLLPWGAMLRLLRRMEMRGEVQGGHFIAGVSGEQYALPEATMQLRALSGQAAPGRLHTLSAADPLNLTGILGGLPRVPRVRRHRLILRDGVPIAWWGKGELHRLGHDGASDAQLLALVGAPITRCPAGPNDVQRPDADAPPKRGTDAPMVQPDGPEAARVAALRAARGRAPHPLARPPTPTLPRPPQRRLPPTPARPQAAPAAAAGAPAQAPSAWRSEGPTPHSGSALSPRPRRPDTAMPPGWSDADLQIFS